MTFLTPKVINTMGANRIEFWKDDKRVEVRPLRGFIGNDGPARDIVLRYAFLQPSDWNHAVVQYENGARQMTSLKGRFGYLGLTNSNSYSSPNFNIDTSTNVAGLTALKGSAPGTGDKIYVYSVSGSNPLLTIESNLACLQILLGMSSAGAVTAGNRYGSLTVNAGITITWDGNPINTSSGIQASPASADSSSKNSIVTIGSAGGSSVTFTNSIGALNTNNRWLINVTWGRLLCYNLIANYCYSLLFQVATSTSFTNSPPIIDGVVSSAIGVSVAVIAPSATIDLECKFTRIQFDTNGMTAAQFIQAIATGQLAVGGSLDLSGCCDISSSVASYTTWLLIKNSSQAYLGSCKIAFADIRPTTVLPTGLAFTDPGTDGELSATITNIASYANADELVFYNASGDAEVGRCSKAQYVANGNFALITGLTNGQEYTLYAKATSDNNTFSEATANATGTPTLAATDAAFLALEDTRNDDPGVAAVLSGTAYQIQGVAKTGTLVALAVPAAPTNVQITNVSDNGGLVSWTPGARSASYKVYVDGVLNTAGVTVNYLQIGSLAANTTYSITVVGTNVTGDGSASTAQTFKTLASDGANDVTTVSTDVVTVVPVTGSPKIVGSGTAKIFDIRVINEALSADAASFYWKDVLENTGKTVIPRG